MWIVKCKIWTVPLKSTFWMTLKKCTCPFRGPSTLKDTAQKNGQKIPVRIFTKSSNLFRIKNIVIFGDHKNYKISKKHFVVFFWFGTFFSSKKCCKITKNVWFEQIFFLQNVIFKNVIILLLYVFKIRYFKIRRYIVLFFVPISKKFIIML